MGYRAPREDCFIVRHPDSMLEAQADFMEIPVEKERYFENGDEYGEYAMKNYFLK